MKSGLTLEALLTSPKAFGLTTASPLQRAIARVVDGLPLADLAHNPDVKTAIGLVQNLPSAPPYEVMILAGIRSGKSLIAAATAFRASQTCDLSGLGFGETPRVSIVSTSLDIGRVVFGHLLGNIQAHPALKALLMEEPNSDSLLLRHPTGRPVEIKVVAGSRAGATLVARWSAGCIFDEAPRMIGAEDGVVNYDDARAAVVGRLLPGAQLISIGSPWAPFGPIYEMVMEHHGKPSADLVIVRAAADKMNPIMWTPAKVERLKRSNPGVYRTDILGEFADPEASLFTAEELELVTRRTGDLPPESTVQYIAIIDPATRGNAWTLTVKGKRRVEERVLEVIVLARQWIGSKVAPLSADSVFTEIADILAPYGVTDIVSDQWAADPLRDIALRHGLNLYSVTTTAMSKVEMFNALAAKVAQGDVELPLDPVVRGDLLAVRKRVTQNGIAFELPRTSDGRHADYAANVALALQQWTNDPPVPKKVLTPTEQIAEAQGAARKKAQEWADRKAKAADRKLHRAIKRGDYSGFSR